MSQEQDLRDLAKAQAVSQKTLHEFNPNEATPTYSKDDKMDQAVHIPENEGFFGHFPHISGIIPVAAWLIVMNEFCERFAYYGASNTFQNYVSKGPTAPVPIDGSSDTVPGALGRGQSTATALSNYFTFFTYLTPLIGAICADQYLGKFRTIVSFSIIYLVGWLFLMATSVPTGYDEAVPRFSGFAFPGYVIAITVIGLGAGGIKSVVSPMCADQVPTEPYVVEKKGKKYVVDPDLTVQHLYNWFYWAINIGALLGQTICVFLEREAFWKAYLLPSCMFLLSICVFVSGRKRYIHVAPRGSVLLEAWRCIRYAFVRRRSHPGARPVPAGTNFAFLEYAKPIEGESQAEASRRTWSPSFPDELRAGLKACSIFPLMSFYWISYNQMLNNLISQAGVMDRPGWLNNDLVNILDPLLLVLVIPIFDYLIYPALSRRNMHFGYMLRITIGFFLGALAMVAAAVIQNAIYNNEENSVTVAWQIIPYALIALSEIFASIGSLEYSYTHAPKNLKAVVSALSLFPNAVASLIGIFISPLAVDPHLTWLYASVAIVAFVAGCIFYALFRRFDVEDKKDLANKRLNQGGQPAISAQ
ncbi:peptide transporter PTR2-A [Fimicolochytrium jonesii]|uniref:peptide transporter PTR2-A n=1 Tax=Fimicolochytrium jonesii TaxID=1396493 RepID=UPI0022FEF1DE|nr:peptide transporter PTR2-A [Fimicolochytrium jonesii]KAI8825982.1 peptide transporter PTR2-A [Fimicolochytrium jonesii]